MILPLPLDSSSISDTGDVSKIVVDQDHATRAQLIRASDVNNKRRMIDEDDWWSNSNIQEEIDALITSKKLAIEVSRVKNIGNVSNIFNGNINNCTI